MGPRALAASSGLAPWSMAVDRDLWYKNFERGSRGLAPSCCLPLRVREGVTLTSSTKGPPNDFYGAIFFYSFETITGTTIGL